MIVSLARHRPQPGRVEGRNADNRAVQTADELSRQQEVQNLNAGMLVPMDAGRQPERRPAGISLGDDDRQLLDATGGVPEKFKRSVTEATGNGFGIAESDGHWAGGLGAGSHFLHTRESRPIVAVPPEGVKRT